MLAATHDWRLPLLEWLVEQVEQAETGGDSAEVVRLRRRIAVVQLQALQKVLHEVPEKTADNG